MTDRYIEKLEERIDELRESARHLVEHKGPCLDGMVRHVSEKSVVALERVLNKPCNK